MLILFDIDGTLVPGRPQAHQDALIAALVEVYGIELRDRENPVADAQPWGKTDRQIVRDVLRPRGLTDEQIDAGLAALEQRACELHSVANEPRLVGEPRERTAAALDALRGAGHQLALLTGNLEPIARQKMAVCGLADYFPPGQGAFGSDAEHRPELVPIARRRAGANGRPHPRSDTLLVGDTPLDVAAAHADDVRCVAITGRRFGRAELVDSGADAVVDDFAELAGLVSAWSRR
jgi:phosphoglycolate phosphatase